MKENFRNWISRGSIVDKFIRYSISERWIDFEQFELVENTNKQGAFSNIYFAIWMEGSDEKAEIWSHNGPIKVIFKAARQFTKRVKNL